MGRQELAGETCLKSNTLGGKIVQYSRACRLWETLLGDKGDTEMDKTGTRVGENVQGGVLCKTRKTERKDERGPWGKGDMQI